MTPGRLGMILNENIINEDNIEDSGDRDNEESKEII